MTVSGRKRFYATVSVRPEGDAFAVYLDAHRLRSPRGAPLLLPARPLADAIAREWEAQDERITPEHMPLTRLVNAATDRTSAEPEATVKRLAAYGETDLLCHWAEYPEELIVRQRSAWQPMLDWAAEALQVRLRAVAGISTRPQETGSLDTLKRHLNAFDPLSLTAAEAAASVTGSIILTLALAYGRLDAGETWRISRVDEDYQMEKWGEDEEAVRQAEIRRTALDAAAMVFAALAPRPAA